MNDVSEPRRDARHDSGLDGSPNGHERSLESTIDEQVRERTVDLQLVVQLSGFRVDEDPERRRLADRYYQAAVAALRAQDPKGQFAIYGDHIRGAVSLPSVGDMRVIVDARKIQFDWIAARDLLFRLTDLEVDVRALLGKVEGRRQRGRIYSIATNVLAALDLELGRPESERPDRTRPTDSFDAVMDYLGRQVGETEVAFADAAERAAQGRYLIGMTCGIALVLAVAGLVSWVFVFQKVHAVNGIAAVTGAVGAVVSVLRRMSEDQMPVDDVRTSPRIVLFLGAVRPVLGAVFGMVVFLLLVAGLVPAVHLPTGPSKLAFVAFWGFVAGFNERFAPDMLATATTRLGSGGRTDPAEEAERPGGESRRRRTRRRAEAPTPRASHSAD